MKYFLCIISFCIINFSHSQEIFIDLKENKLNARDSVFKILESNHLYTLSKKGQILDKKIISYEDTIDEYLFLESKYLIDLLGGKILVLREDKFERLDNSFQHKSQINSNIFIRNDTIFKYGGYGFFESRNFFTFFSNQTREWEYFKTNSILFPPETHFSKFFLKDDFFYVIGGYKSNKNTSLNKPNKEIWRFSFKEKNWDYLGLVKIDDNIQYKPFDFFYDGIFYFIVNKKLYGFNTEDSSILTYKDLNIIEKGIENYKPLVLNNTLFSIGFAHNLNNYYIYQTSFNDLKVSNKISLKKQFKLSFHEKILIFLIFLISISLLFFYNTSKNLKLRKDRLFYGFKFVILNQFELDFFKLFLENSEVENGQLVELIKSKIDYTQKLRIKEETIININYKLNNLTKNKFYIEKHKSNNDRRYMVYKLKIRNTKF